MAKFNKSKINETFKNYGLTPEEASLVQEDLRKGDQESAVQRIAKAQERQLTKLKESTGVDVLDLTLAADIVNHVFRVLEFDRGNTTMMGFPNVLTPI